MANIKGIPARKYITDLLKTLNYDVYFIGQSYRYRDHPYIVLKAMERTQDAINRMGAYQYYDVMVYVPDTSIVLLDTIMDRIEILLSAQSEILDLTLDMSQDYHDIDINMLMRSISFRVPQIIRGCK